MVETRRMREQAWLVMVILQDCGMRPDEVFPDADREPSLGCRTASGFPKAKRRKLAGL